MLPGLAVGAAQGLIEGGINQIFAGANARRDWRYKQKEMALQQQYALEQMEKQSELSYNQWQKQFDYENAYNDPSALMERYAAAGINPSAVLGNSGVSVQGTMSGGSAPSPSASGPRAGMISQGSNIRLDPTALSQMQANESVKNRNNAGAERDLAEAEWYRSNTLSRDLNEALARSQKALNDAGVNDKNEQARLKSALADIYAAEAVYADIMATYKMQDYIVRYAKDVETYNYIKKYNDEYLDGILTSSIVLNFARAFESSAHGGLLNKESEIANVRLADLQNWFEINWETPIPVREINEKGKPTGKVINMTGKEIHSKLLGLAVEHSDQETAANWFKTRSEKNAFGYAMINAVIHGIAGMAASYYGGKAMGKGFAQSGTERTYIENYNAKGSYIGGSYVSKEMLSNRDRR